MSDLIRITADAPSAPPILALDKTATAAKLGNPDVAAVEDAIRQATALAESLVSLRWIWFRNYRAYMKGRDDERLYLDGGRPIAVVISVKLGDDGQPLVEDEDFEVFADDGFLRKSDGWGSCGDRWVVEWSGGWWLPSMGDETAAAAAGASRLTDKAAHVEGAIFDIVKATLASQDREPGLKREDGPDLELEYFTGDVAAPKSAVAIIRSLGPPVAI